MPKFSISKIRGRFSKESRQARLESRYTKQLENEKSKYEKYAAHKTEDDRIKKLQSEIKSYRQMRGAKERKVKIGGHTFSI